MTKSKSEQKHDSIVNELEDMLLIDDYEMWQFLEYNRSDYFIHDILNSGGRRVISPVGEVDLLRQMDDYWEFYEIKSNYSEKTYHHAESQYTRFRNHFKRDSVVGFFYCGSKLIQF